MVDIIFLILRIIIQSAVITFIIYQMLRYQFAVIKRMEQLILQKKPLKDKVWLIFEDIAVLGMSIVVIAFFIYI